MENKGSSCCKLGVILSVLALIVASVAYFCPKKEAGPCSSSTFDEKIKGIMVDVIKQNPQLLMDAMGEGMAKKREDTIKQISTDVAAQKAEIIKQSLKFGKTDSKNSIICFFDPLCKHCIEFQKSMVKLIKAKKDVGFNMLPVAVLGEDSVTLAKVYFAVYEKSPEKAIEFIEKITAEESNMDKASIEKALKAAGLSYKEIEGMLADSDKKLSANGAIAEKLRIPVVPAIFVTKGSEVNMIQATSVDQLLQIVEGAKPEEKSPADDKKDEKPAKEEK